MENSPQRSNTASGTKVYFRLLSYLRGDVYLLITSFVGFLIYAACDSAFAWWMKELVDSIEQGLSGKRWWLASLVVGIFLLRGIAGIAGGYLSELVARRLINRVRLEMFGHLLRLPSTFYEKYTSGTVLARLIHNVENLATASTSALRILVRGGFTIIGLLLFMLYTNWKLTCLFLLVTPVVAFVIVVVTQRLRQLSRGIQNAMSSVSERAGEVFKGYEVVKIFDGYEPESKQFTEIIENDRRQRLKLVLVNDFSATFVQILFAMAIGILIIIAMQPKILLVMSSGEFVAFVSAMVFISRPILKLTRVNAIIQQGVAAAESIFEVLDIPKEDDNGLITLEHTSGHIEFSGVRFRYDDEGKSETRWVIDNVSLDIPPGTTCALVGPSGSGKTTLAKLVARFYDPLDGVIKVDGNPLKEISIESLRQNIALVNQNVSLFNASIAENIAYGAMHEYEWERIIEAADQAQVSEFARDLPKGLHTNIGESGILLSGGQRQRIAIARAFLKDAPILILDEATSALDNNSERLIQLAIERLMHNRTSLIIAHRLSTIENSDLIVVLDRGKIVEKGTHQELLSLEGHYSRMHEKGADFN